MSLEKHLAEAWGAGAWGTDPEAAVLATAARFPFSFSQIARKHAFGRLRLGSAERAELIAGGRGLSFTEKHQLYLYYLCSLYTGPLWPDELELSDRMVEAMRVLRYEWYHGGRSGRKVGDKLLPPKLTGVTPRNLGLFPDSEADDWVWMSPISETAGIYTLPALTPDARLYRIQPEGKITVDPRCLRMFLLWMDDPELEVDLPRLALMIPEYRCERATVLEVTTAARSGTGGGSES